MSHDGDENVYNRGIRAGKQEAIAAEHKRLLSDEAVERAAIGIHDAYWHSQNWEDRSSEYKQRYKNMARAGIKAAIGEPE